jgi:O-antigen ligase
MLTKGHLIIRQFLNGYAVPFAMFVCAKNSFRSKKEVDRFLLWFAVPLSIYFPLNHIFEHYRITQLVFPRYILSPVIAGVEIQWGERALGAFLQPVATGMAMVSVYVLSLYRLSIMRGTFPKLVRVFITLITPIAVFFSYTRSVYLGFFAAMAVLGLFSRRQRLIGMFIIVAVVLGVLGNWSNVTTSERSAGGLATEHTAMARLVLAEVSMKMFADRPFVGVGFTRFMEYSPAYVKTVRTTLLGYKESWIGQNVNQHNQLLTILTEIGLIGFLPLVFLYITLWRTLHRAVKVDSDNYDRELVVTIWAVWAGYTMNILFMEPRFFEFMNVLPYICAGIIVGGYQRAMLRRPPRNTVNERS